MAQIFVSHSSADNPLALRVRDCLGDLGYDSVFLDVSPTEGLVPGAAWRDQLFTNLDRSDALIFVGTPTANVSLWCHSELALARWLRKPVLSLLFDDVDPHELVADIQGINLASADLSPDAIRPGLVALGLEQATRWDASRSPFPGLRAFDESYAPVFFGRERQVDQLRQLVDPPSRARQGLVVPVLGPSGSGKSSLVRAGLVAALRPAPDWVVSEPWTPSDAPLAELSLALAHAAKRHEVALDADQCNELLRTPGGMPEYLRRLREGGSVPADARVLVVIDQAEELVTLTAESERKAFFEALALACTPPSPLRVVMTARTDMWDSVSALTNRFGMAVAPAVLHVPPLSRADLARVIAEPAKRSHLTIEDGLLQRLVEDTASGDALPLLAYTLARMTADATDGRLTHELYDKVGGVRGAIASRAAEVAHDARTEAEVAAAILHIVGTGENRPVTRLARVETVPPAQRAILDDLVDARLVVVRESAGVQVYAPAHEALFSAWPPLAEMISRRHDDLRLRSRLERRAADWHEAGAGSSGLLTGDELDQAGDWLHRSPDLQTPDIAAYVAASRRRERRNRFLRVGVAAVVTALALALVVVVVVNAASDRRQARDARVGELRAIAERELVHDPAAAAVALLEALKVNASDSATSDLARRLLASPARDVAYTDDEFPLVYVRAGRRLAITNGTSDEELLVWDTATGSLYGRLPVSGIAGDVRSDDRVAAILGNEGTSLWDLGSQPPVQLSILPRTATQADFSADGSLLVTHSGTLVSLWDVADPAAATELVSWSALGSAVNAVTVTDDGTVYTSGDTALVTAWTPLTDGQPRVIVPDPPVVGQSVNGLHVDEGGALVLVSATSSGSGAAVYDLSTGTVADLYVAAPDPSRARQQYISNWVAAMDREGRTVVVFEVAGRGFAYQVDHPEQPVGNLTRGHTATVSSATFTTDDMVVSAGLDGSVRVWDPTAATGSYDGDATDLLCQTFGPRIDADSWRLALGDTPLSSPCPDSLPVEAADLTLPVTHEPPTPRDGSDVVLEEHFDDAETSFNTQTYVNGSGTSSTEISDGRLHVTNSGLPEGFLVWNEAPVSITSAAYTVTAGVFEEATAGSCGLTLSTATTRLTVSVDPATGHGVANWFIGGKFDRALELQGRPTASAEMSLTRIGARLVIRAGGRVVKRLDDETFAHPTAVGVVTGGSDNTCGFDDFLVTQTQ